MAKRTTIPSDLDLTDIRQLYGITKSRDYYKGTSFNMSGEWLPETHYYNDEFIVDFVIYKGAVLYCTLGHMSSAANEPVLIYDDYDSIIGIEPSEYWTFVLSGVTKVDAPIAIEVNLTSQINGVRSDFNLPSDLTGTITLEVYYNGQRLFKYKNYSYNDETKVITTGFIPKVGGELVAIVWEQNSGLEIRAANVTVNNENFTELVGNNVQEVFNNIDLQIKVINDKIADSQAALFHTNPNWEADSLAVLNSWINPDGVTAYDPINEREITNFDVYRAIEENINYYWDSGAWLPLIPIPTLPVYVIESWSNDDATINVKLSGVPKNVTEASFRVYSTRTGAVIPVQSVLGAGVEYQLLIPKQTSSYGINFIG